MVHFAGLVFTVATQSHIVGQLSQPGCQVRLREMTVSKQNYKRYFLQITQGKKLLSTEVGKAGFGASLVGLAQDKTSGDYVAVLRVGQNDVDEGYAFAIHAGKILPAWHETLRGKVDLQSEAGTPVLFQRLSKNDADLLAFRADKEWHWEGGSLERHLRYSPKDHLFIGVRKG